ncbi:MAG: A/G-specific adenine glycosylase [Acidimicrobiia bacterium]|nr:A/G-specific adenine glycosylase [Acidimicrobiia bacterium]
MLQQTQVPRVVPAYSAFLSRFPSAPACAASPVAEVVRAWAGLGYNRRAVHLHGAAVAVVERHGGVFPEDLVALMALPGVGPYTARAVLTFAFGRDVGIVESNTGRVLARLAGEPLSPVRAQRLADELVPEGKGWGWNQAMIDLGATVCLRRAPKCDECPVAAHCRWHGGPDPSAPAAKQSTFSGSDRQGRGRLVDAMRLGPVGLADLPQAAGWPDDPARAHRVAGTLVADGLALEIEGVLRLP